MASFCNRKSLPPSRCTVSSSQGWTGPTLCADGYLMVIYSIHRNLDPFDIGFRPPHPPPSAPTQQWHPQDAIQISTVVSLPAPF
ncbi:hypothetical protein VTK56DRAFT_7248 [Thermocarpiscus australiensis]